MYFSLHRARCSSLVKLVSQSYPTIVRGAGKLPSRCCAGIPGTVADSRWLARPETCADSFFSALHKSFDELEIDAKLKENLKSEFAIARPSWIQAEVCAQAVVAGSV